MPTGIALAVPEGYVALVHPRSGLAARHGLSIVNTPGTIDAGLPRRDQGAAGQPRPARADRAAPRRPGGPAGLPAGRAGGVRRGGGRCPTAPVGAAATVLPEASPVREPDDRSRGDDAGEVPSQVRATSVEDGRRRLEQRRPPSVRARTTPTSCPPDDPERVDLGSLLIAPEPGRELRLQVDEASGAVQSVVLAGADGALELRAFAAPRNGDLWSEARPQIAAEVAQARRHRHRARGPLGHRAGLPGPGAHARRQDRHPGVPRSSASTARAGCCARTLLGKPATDLDGAGGLGGRASAGSPSAAAPRRCRSARRCR